MRRCPSTSAASIRRPPGRGPILRLASSWHQDDVVGLEEEVLAADLDRLVVVEGDSLGLGTVLTEDDDLGLLGEVREPPGLGDHVEHRRVALQLVSTRTVHFTHDRDLEAPDVGDDDGHFRVAHELAQALREHVTQRQRREPGRLNFVEERERDETIWPNRNSPGERLVPPDDDLEHEALTRAFPVRPDGHISLPLLHDVQAAGLTPLALRDVLTKRLSEFMTDPEVSVIVTDVRSFKISVMGEVHRPGRYELKSNTTVLY